MIRLKRPEAPTHLAEAAAVGVAKLWAAWRAGKPIEVQASIYGAKAVKAALRKAQHDKCAYCETRLVRDYGQVEHYRPKAGWKQVRADTLSKPGYFWLAYEWTNFFFSCAMCNDAGHKANVFPLGDPAKRATPSTTDITQEQPLLLNPFRDQPEDHIDWNEDVPSPHGGSRLGQASIDTFGLAIDETLIDERRGHVERIRLMLEAAETGQLSCQLQAQYVRVLRLAIEDSAPYAAMIRANFKARISALS